MQSLNFNASIATFRATCQFHNRLGLKMVESEVSWAGELEAGLAVAPVSAFLHAPLSPGWQVLHPGMVVEVLHSVSSSSAWLATVLRMAGYQVQETCMQFYIPQMSDRLGENGMIRAEFFIIQESVFVEPNRYRRIGTHLKRCLTIDFGI